MICMYSLFQMNRWICPKKVLQFVLKSNKTEFVLKSTGICQLARCLSLTEYCREEFEKFTTFLTSKNAKIGQFSGEIGQFSE